MRDSGHYSVLCFFFKRKTAYEMRISDLSSDVCSSDLCASPRFGRGTGSDRKYRISGRIVVARSLDRGSSKQLLPDDEDVFRLHWIVQLRLYFLPLPPDFYPFRGTRQGRPARQRQCLPEALHRHIGNGAGLLDLAGAIDFLRRSEERSVGKEGGST